MIVTFGNYLSPIEHSLNRNHAKQTTQTVCKLTSSEVPRNLTTVSEQATLKKQQKKRYKAYAVFKQNLQTYICLEFPSPRHSAHLHPLPLLSLLSRRFSFNTWHMEQPNKTHLGKPTGTPTWASGSWARRVWEWIERYQPKQLMTASPIPQEQY